MGAHSHRPPRLLSLLEISRQTRIPYSRVCKVFSRGKLRPDFISGNSYLFVQDRLPTLKELIKL
jgi:hypothetical protein